LLPNHLASWAHILDESWPDGAGPLPDEKSVGQAKQLGARSRTKYGLAWAMFCRPDGASRAEIIAACGGPHFNAARNAQRAGKLDFMTGITKDRGRVYYVGPPGSHPGGLGVEPVGDDDTGDGEESGELDELSDAERVRLTALDQYIQPARERGDRTVSINAGKLHESLELKQAHANVCQALGGEKFQRLANVPPPRIEGPQASTTTTFHFDLSRTPKFDNVNAAMPTNLILYGPPGTGKTYRTALVAVRLCDGSAPEDRAELMKRYGELERAGRIGFVTFHQNFSYEDFVEGLRPETDGSVGFRLEPRKGIFREMAALAEQARKTSAVPSKATRLDLSERNFWKVSLGESGAEDQIYEAAIAGNYVVLGWGGDVDWSASIYDQRDEIERKWAEVAPPGARPSNVSQLWTFRSEIRRGDIVIVPHGNKAFRAIGEVVGDYEFSPTGEGTYNHRRSVQWLLVLDEPLPLDTIVEGNFTMRSVYQIVEKRIRKEALERLVGKQGDTEASPENPAVPEAFVLLIDEINRANISKVFGELITLLEPDKRLGAVNELRVKLPYSDDTFGVPSNLHIVGTMNTADRSIALLDTALRRRFVFEEMMPTAQLLVSAATRTGIDLASVLTAINNRIEYLFDREHQIGHAFFMDCNVREDVDAVMRHKVIPLLQEYFFEDWSRLALVLGEREGTKEGLFLNCEKLSPPAGFDGENRWRWVVRQRFADNAYQQLINRSSASSDAADESAEHFEGMKTVE
jgi:5-methylcytosine-specific restriction enzyme B